MSMSTASSAAIEILDDDKTVRIDLTFASEIEAERFFDNVAEGLTNGSLRIDRVPQPAGETVQ